MGPHGSPQASLPQGLGAKIQARAREGSCRVGLCKAHPQSTAELQVCRARPIGGDTSHKVLLSKLQRPPEMGEGRARATWKTQERKTPQKKNQNISPINVC